MDVTVNGTPYSVSFGAAGSAPAAQTSAPVASVTGGVDVKAPVAGTLFKQCFANGTKVSKGQTVLTLESMKMELEVKAGASGKVHFLVSPGAQISNGMVVAELN